MGVRKLRFAVLVLLVTLTAGCVNPFGPSMATINGKITDNNGRPVAGATVVATSLNTNDRYSAEREVGTTDTSANGAFSLNVPVGYRPVTVLVSKEGLIDGRSYLANTSHPPYKVDVELSGAPVLATPSLIPTEVPLGYQGYIDASVILESARSTRVYSDVIVSVLVYGEDGGPVGNVDLATGGSVAPALYVGSVDPYSLDPGEYSVQFVAVDEFGNRSNTAEALFTVVDDTL